MNQDQLESHRKQLLLGFEKERNHLQDEQEHKVMNIQTAIEKLNIGTSDKIKLKEEVDDLNRQKREMEDRLKSLE
jgi:hypothetical protein